MINLFYTLNCKVIKKTLIIFRCSKEQKGSKAFLSFEESDFDDDRY